MLKIFFLNPQWKLKNDQYENVSSQFQNDDFIVL